MARRRSIRGESSNNKAYILFSVTILIVVLIAYMLFIESSKRIQLDEINCPVSGSQKITAILVDATDKLTPVQIRYLENRITQILKSSLQYQRYEIYFLDSKLEALEPVIAICNPGDGADKSELTSNIRRIKEKWESEFYNSITEIFTSLKSVPEADSSPIIESMKSLSVNAFVGKEAMSKELIVISDLLQFSPLLSHYNQSYSSDLSMNRRMSTQLPYLDGVEVTFFYISRPTAIEFQTNKHVVFWEKLVNQSGGRFVDLEFIK